MEELWQMETGFWLKGIDYFEQSLAPSCLMALPGMGLLDRPRVIEGLRAAPRWTHVVMRDQLAIEPAPGVAILAYEAEGQRAGGAPYRALCTSTYVRKDGHWSMVQHQQTPVTN